MIIVLRKWWLFAKFIFLLIVLSYLVSLLLQEVTQWIQPTERYKEPSGNAVKVVNQQPIYMETDSMKDRLRLFYWYGE